MLKTVGYLVSAVSVFLLAAVSWSSASKNPVLVGCLLLGAASSITGMLLRWLSFLAEQRQKRSEAES
jgi:hypothetical protein